MYNNLINLIISDTLKKNYDQEEFRKIVLELFKHKINVLSNYTPEVLEKVYVRSLTVLNVNFKTI